MIRNLLSAGALCAVALPTLVHAQNDGSLTDTVFDGDYANTYFTVSPAGSVASGLPTFQARGGWKNVGINALVGVDFDGDLTNGGLAGFVTGGYTRLLNDAKRTPLTSIRGDSDQWLVGAGLAFTF